MMSLATVIGLMEQGFCSEVRMDLQGRIVALRMEGRWWDCDPITPVIPPQY